MSGCSTFHERGPWSVPEPSIVRNGWRMEARYCRRCGLQQTRRLYRLLAHTSQEKNE
jgi:hypothetical protein